MLLLIGNASNPMRQWLLNTLNESGLRKLRKQFESAFNELQSITLNHLHRVLEVLLSRLSELKSLSRW